jgi:XTP/dITP diphosphohydrolase
MKKILIATSNPGKIEEIIYGLKPLKKFGIEFVRLNDVGVEEKVEESGKTFCENAKIKAVFYGEKTNLPTIADDGGLIIPYLNNEPGVKSRRWLGYEASDEELIQYTLKRLNNHPKKNRVAFLQTCVCFYHPQTKKIFFQEENIRGWLAEKPSPRRIKGYPFRALFIIEKFNKYYDELTDKEHCQVNHRLQAIKKLIPKIKQSLNL